MSDYPRKNAQGDTVWACCESTIGPRCGHKAEQTYRVTTYSYACTAYVRTTLRRALELQSQDNVWAGTEYVNAVRGMVPNTYTTTRLPDESVWELTRTEIMAIHTALKWRKGSSDGRVRHVIRAEWSFIEAEIARVVRDIWHSEGKYWM